LGIARESLSDTTLGAPFAGRVARRLLEQGAQAQPGEPVLEIDGIGLEVSFTVAQSQREGLAIGDQITVLMDQDGETIEISGSITEISSRAIGIGAFEVRANVPGEIDQLQAGMAVDVRVENAPDVSADSGITIPLTAFKPTARGEGEVYLIDPQSGKIEARPVRLGPASENSVIVTGGLKKGDQIVSRGVAFVERGETVNRIGKGAERYAK
ncbi:MAG: efflux RND transporter periplasmic adaptor subunit, partial [Pacificimonas sp.]